jgi:hypothetical protein
MAHVLNSKQYKHFLLKGRMEGREHNRTVYNRTIRDRRKYERREKG